MLPGPGERAGKFEVFHSFSVPMEITPRFLKWNYGQPMLCRDSHIQSPGLSLMQMLVTRFVAAFSIALLCQSIEAGDVERTRFLNEAPASWQKYRSMLTGYKAIGNSETVDLRTGMATKDSPNSIRKKKGCVVYVDPDPRLGSVEQRAIGRNKNYAFVLRRSAGTDQWEIQDLSLNLNGPAKTGAEHLCESIEKGVSGLTELDSIPLDELVKEPAFKLVDVNSIQIDGLELMEVHYEFLFNFRNASRNRSNIFARKGWVRLDPAKFWLIYSAEYSWMRTENDEFATSKILPVEYSEIRPGIPVETKRIRETRFRPDGPKAEKLGLESGEVRLISEVSYEADDDPSERDFTLSAFGLPEPVRPGIRWWWVLALVLGALLLAVPAWQRRRTQH